MQPTEKKEERAVNRGPLMETADKECTRLRNELAEMTTRIWRLSQELEGERTHCTQEHAAYKAEHEQCEALRDKVAAMMRPHAVRFDSEPTCEQLWQEIERLEVENARLAFELSHARAQVMELQAAVPPPEPEPLVIPRSAKLALGVVRKALPLPQPAAAEGNSQEPKKRTQRMVFSESLFGTIVSH